jgi:ribosomal protein S18 acetylase RimI-like enzyme
MEPAPPAEPPAPTRIREAAAEDLPAIVGIYIRAYAQPPWLEHHEPAGAERYLRWVLGVPQTFGLVVEEAGQVRGFILAGRRAYADFVEDWERLADPPPEGWPPVPGRLGYIWELAVDPGAQRRGHGAALLQAAIERLRREGVEAVLLRSSERAIAAATLYRRFGFQRLPIHERYDPLAGPWLLRLRT